MNQTPSQPKGLATRVFNNSFFGITWVVFLAILMTRFWWIRNAALVWWVYGREAYFSDGVRVLHGKPTKFSTGMLVPQWPNFVTGFAFFIIIAFGLSWMLIFALRLYERIRKPRPT